jgi:VWFA-related protein
MVAFFTLAVVAAQTPQETPVFRTSTAAVMVDVVVRDRAGQPVVGLTREDFEVFEDSAPQRIIDFEALTSQPRISATSSAGVRARSAESVAPGGTSAQSIVALVFHQLSHQSRAAAVKAARSMVAALSQDEYVGIFVVDLAVTTLAPFTRNTRELQHALDVLLKTPPVNLGPSSATGIMETDAPPGVYLPQGNTQAEDMRRRLEAGVEGPQHAGAQAASLTDLIARLARFPGRKSVILFSEGLSVSPRLEAVVDHARAENVSIYTISAGGLGVDGRMALPVRDIDPRELTGTSRVGRASWQHAFPEMDFTAGLRPLAELTGGFLVSDTNDLVAALSEVNADRRAYYVLAYASTNEALDGTVRHIEVRVKRPGLSVRARTGFVAARPTP